MYKRRPVSKLSDFGDRIPFGFVYKLSVLTEEGNRYYIGSKYLTHSKRVKLGKKELSKLKDKRSSKFKTITKESDWLTYCGSPKCEVNPFNDPNTTREILELCYNSKQLRYAEMKWLILEDALLKDEYINNNILGKFYKKDFDDTGTTG